MNKQTSSLVTSLFSLTERLLQFRTNLDSKRIVSSAKDRPMRIMWPQECPALHGSGRGNIFIKNFDPSIDSNTLEGIFNGFGPILSCETVSNEHGSKGYGFVQFESEKCAQDAIENVHGMLFNNKKLYVAKFVPKKKRLKKNYKFNNVFVKNFGHDINDDGLRSLFAKFGNIISYKIMRDDAGQSKGFGFVCFEKSEDAEKAVNELDGFELNGKPLFIGRAQKSEERQQMLKDKFKHQKTKKKSQFRGINLYIKNLDDNVTEDHLRTKFSVFGNVTNVKIMNQNGGSKSFGFVCFSKSEEATKAIEGMNGQTISEKPLDVSLALSKEKRKKTFRHNRLNAGQSTNSSDKQQMNEKRPQFQGVNLYIKNFGDDVTEDYLRTEFSVFGDVTSVRIITRNGGSKCFGFVCFNKSEEATKAIEGMNGRTISGKPLDVSLALSKEERRTFRNTRSVTSSRRLRKKVREAETVTQQIPNNKEVK